MRRRVDRAVQRLEFGDGDWVDLATRITFLDRRKIERALAGPQLAAAGGTLPAPADITTAELDLVAGNVELLMRTIVAWGGPGFCSQAAHPHEGECTPEPITREAIEGLDEAGDLILLELQRRMVQPAPDFTKPPSLPSSTAGAAESTQTDS